MFKRLFDNAPALDGPELARLAQAAAERRVEVVMGLHERLGASLYNTMLFIDARAAAASTASSRPPSTNG
jgi:predicted amidohydrolase